jgi:hypothetical protein
MLNVLRSELARPRTVDEVVAVLAGLPERAAITYGPGVTNALTAIVEAARSRTPLVVLTGDTPAIRGYFQHDAGPLLCVVNTGSSVARGRRSSSMLGA